MTELRDDQLVITLEDGEEVLCNILFTYHSEDFGKDYVFFYEASEEEQEEKTIDFASYVERDGEIGELNGIESDEEYEMLCDVFDAFLEDYSDENEECENCECDCEEDADSENCGCCCKKNN